MRLVAAAFALLVPACSAPTFAETSGSTVDAMTILGCGDDYELPRFSTSVARRVILKVDQPEITVAVDQGSGLITRVEVQENGRVIASNPWQGGPLQNLRVRPGEEYLMLLSVQTGRYGDPRPEWPAPSVQIRCCDSVTTSLARGPGTAFRDCGDCGWQFCLPSGAWSTACEARPDAQCPGGQTCGREGTCASESSVRNEAGAPDEPSAPNENADPIDPTEPPPEEREADPPEGSAEEACYDDYWCDGLCDTCLGDDPDCCEQGGWDCDGFCDACDSYDPDCCLGPSEDDVPCNW